MNARIGRDRYLSDDELARLFAAVRSRRHKNRPRDHAFLALLANTGIRPGEALRLERGEVFPRARQPWIRVRRPHRRGTARPLTELMLHHDVARVVAAYTDTVADRAARLFPFTKRQSARIFRYYANRAGLPTWHRVFSLRHSVGMRIYRHTDGDVRLIQGVMGHAHLRAAYAYAHVSPERLRRMHADLGTCY